MPITYHTFEDAFFPEVAYSPVGDLWLIYQTPAGVVKVYKNLTLVHEVGLGGGSIAFPKALGDSMIYRGAGELPYLWLDLNAAPGTAQLLSGSPTTGNDPVVIGGGWVAWQQGAYPISRRAVGGGAVSGAGNGRPTGLSRVVGSGTVVLVDTDRVVLNPDGTTFGTRPGFASPAIAVEGPSGGVLVRNGNTLTLWAGQTAFTPRIARNSGGAGEFAVTTWGAPHGVRLAVIDAGEFSGGDPLPEPGGGGGGGGRPTPLPPKLGRTGPSPITPRPTIVRPSRPVYPHVGRVQDRDAQQALRILFERAHSVEQRLDTAEGVDQQIADLSSQLAAVQAQLRANENALRGADAVAGARFGVGGSVDPLPVPDGGDPGGGSPGSGPGPGGPGGGGGTGSGRPTRALPMLLSVVQDYANANPAELTNSCQNAGGTWDFMDGVVDALRAVDGRFGYNCKRGNCSDPSHDAIAYYWGEGAPFEGARQVYVVDIIGGHCGPNPTPTWTDQTSPSGNTNGAGWTSRGRF